MSAGALGDAAGQDLAAGEYVLAYLVHALRKPRRGYPSRPRGQRRWWLPDPGSAAPGSTAAPTDLKGTMRTADVRMYHRRSRCAAVSPLAPHRVNPWPDLPV